MLLTYKKIFFNLIFNFSLFLLLMIGIQNSSEKAKVNFIVNETIFMPLSFIIGVSFISGSFAGTLLTINSRDNYDK